nr:hypothetical protein [Burkholderia ubonensis]
MLVTDEILVDKEFNPVDSDATLLFVVLRPVDSDATLLFVVLRPVDSDVTLLFVVLKAVERELIPVDVEPESESTARFVAFSWEPLMASVLVGVTRPAATLVSWRSAPGLPMLTTLAGLAPAKLYVTPPITAFGVGFGDAVTEPEPSAIAPGLLAVAPAPKATVLGAAALARSPIAIASLPPAFAALPTATPAAPAAVAFVPAASAFTPVAPSLSWLPCGFPLSLTL